MATTGNVIRAQSNLNFYGHDNSKGAVMIKVRDDYNKHDEQYNELKCSPDRLGHIVNDPETSRDEGLFGKFRHNADRKNTVLGKILRQTESDSQIISKKLSNDETTLKACRFIALCNSAGDKDKFTIEQGQFFRRNVEFNISGKTIFTWRLPDNNEDLPTNLVNLIDFFYTVKNAEGPINLTLLTIEQHNSMTAEESKP